LPVFRVRRWDHSIGHHLPRAMPSLRKKWSHYPGKGSQDGGGPALDLPICPTQLSLTPSLHRNLGRRSGKGGIDDEGYEALLGLGEVVFLSELVELGKKELIQSPSRKLLGGGSLACGVTFRRFISVQEEGRFYRSAKGRPFVLKLQASNKKSV